MKIELDDVFDIAVGMLCAIALILVLVGFWVIGNRVFASEPPNIGGHIEVHSKENRCMTECHCPEGGACFGIEAADEHWENCRATRCGVGYEDEQETEDDQQDD